ncbi:sugar transferase [Sphingomonas sp. LB2R24]|jgi:lipopolysaccharide/colanic/teichoic acid biosynthesis glycosyltransferase
MNRTADDSAIGVHAKTGMVRASAHMVRIRIYALLLALDVTAIILGVVMAIPLRVTHANWFGVLILLLPLFVTISFNSKAYSVDALHSTETGIWASLQSLFLSYTLLFLTYYLFKVDPLASRLIMICSAVAAAILMYGFREVVGQWLIPYLGTAVTAEILIVDRVSLGDRASITTVDAEALGLRPDLQDPTMLNRFSQVIRGLDRAVILCPPDARRAWAMMLKGAGVRGEIIVEDVDELRPIGVGALDGRFTLGVSAGPLTLRNRAMKRAFDVAVSAAALIAMFPVLLLIAIAIKVDSPGPILFRQRRVGRGNAFFDILKFRSMRVESSDADGARSTQRDDNRITRVGRLIRSTSVDELPQLMNVLLGHMSIVGPRPHALGSLAGEDLFWEVDERYWHRHALKPGITGLAQVRGFRGATHTRDDLVLRLQADLEYADGWRLKRDLIIIFATFKVLVHKNTY